MPIMVAMGLSRISTNSVMHPERAIAPFYTKMKELTHNNKLHAPENTQNIMYWRIFQLVERLAVLPCNAVHSI